MTAQIIIGNGHSIVVASDGASTMSGRTYGSAEKIVPLLFPHRIAVLHAGSVGMHGVSVPALIENWRLTLPSEPLDSVRAYSESFGKYLIKEIPNFTSPLELLMDYLDALYFDLKSVKDRLIQSTKDTAMTVEGCVAIWADAISKMRGSYAEYTTDSWVESTFRMLSANAPENPVLEAATKGTLYKSVSEWECTIPGILGNLFGEFPVADEISALQVSYIKNLMMHWWPAPWSSRVNLNFVGYGKDEILPSYHNSNLFGMANGRFFMNDIDGFMAYRMGSGHFVINTIGMSDDIDRFLRDMGTDLHVAKNSLDEALAYLSEEQGSKSLAEMSGEISSLFSETHDHNRWLNFTRVRGTLSNLNPSNLARVADGLIRLQALAMDAAGDLPSVGNGVVVGVITRSEGFVWQENLNSHLH
jgi:hypothetical protein